MRWLLIILSIFLISGISGCRPESANVPGINTPDKAISQMSYDELRQQADHYQQLAESSYRLPGITAYSGLSQMYQNEIIIRLLERGK